MVTTRVAHEAMNDIETIAGLSYLIQNQSKDPEVHAYARQIEERTLALGALLRSFLRELKNSG
jgi:hypothetical protein